MYSADHSYKLCSGVIHKLLADKLRGTGHEKSVHISEQVKRLHETLETRTALQCGYLTSALPRYTDRLIICDQI